MIFQSTINIIKGDIKILFSEMAHAEVQTANMGITKYLVIYLKIENGYR